MAEVSTVNVISDQNSSCDVSNLFANI